MDEVGITKTPPCQIRIETLTSRINPKVPFPHRHNFFQLLLFKSGSGWHEIDFIKQKIKKGMLFIMKPGQVHRWSFAKNSTGYIIEFIRDTIDANIPISIELTDKIVISKDLIYLQPAELEALYIISQRMLDECIQVRTLYNTSLQAMLTATLVQVIRSIEGEVKSPIVFNISTKFIDLINRNYRTERNVDFYLKKLGISAKTLANHLRRSYGKSPRQMIQERFLLEAKRLLFYTELSIAEVGYAIGFEDPNYFTRFFRQKVEMSPAEFRRKIREQ